MILKSDSILGAFRLMIQIFLFYIFGKLIQFFMGISGLEEPSFGFTVGYVFWSIGSVVMAIPLAVFTWKLLFNLGALDLLYPNCIVCGLKRYGDDCNSCEGSEDDQQNSR